MTTEIEVDAAQAFRDLFENAPIAYHELNACGLIQRVNRLECELLGYTPEEMIGRPIWAFVQPENQEASRERVIHKLSQVVPLKPFVRPYLSKEGSVVSFEVHEEYIMVNGSIAGIRSMLIDVTEKLRLEQAVQERERWLETTIGSLSEGVVAVDALGMVQLWNPAASTVSGCRRADPVGMDLAELFEFASIEEDAPPPPSLRTLITTAWSGPATLRCCCGSQAQVRLTSSPISYQEKIIGVVFTLQPFPA